MSKEQNSRKRPKTSAQSSTSNAKDQIEINNDSRVGWMPGASKKSKKKHNIDQGDSSNPDSTPDAEKTIATMPGGSKNSAQSEITERNANSQTETNNESRVMIRASKKRRGIEQEISLNPASARVNIATQTSTAQSGLQCTTANTRKNNIENVSAQHLSAENSVGIQIG